MGRAAAGPWLAGSLTAPRAIAYLVFGVLNAAPKDTDSSQDQAGTCAYREIPCLQREGFWFFFSKNLSELLAGTLKSCQNT